MKIGRTIRLMLVLVLPALFWPLAIHTKAEENLQGQKKSVLMTESEIMWTEAPASLPAGSQIAVLEGDPKKPGPFTMRIRFPANAAINPHTHPTDERLTVLSGTLYFGLGEIADASNAKALTRGSFFMIPAGDAMFAFTTDEETVVQLNAEGPWGITYLDSVG